METTFMAFLAGLGAVGWIIRVWIILPINTTLVSLNKAVSKLESITEMLTKQNAETVKDIAVISRDVKSAWNKIDDLNARVQNVEQRCIECKHCGKD